MNSHSAVRPRLRAWVATILTALLVAGGLAAGAAPANAAPGDVAGATLDWGIKQSFRDYISGPIAHGGWTVAGVSDATPFSWSGGAGSADQGAATGFVNYGGSIHFTGHEAFGGLPAGSYALDLTISNVRVQQTSSTSATIVADTVSNSLASPTEFVTTADVPFAAVDLASATAASDATTVAFTGAPAVLTAEGAAAFAGFYGAGTALDPVSFSWPVEQAPPPPVPTISVSKSSDISPAGELITVTGTGFNPSAPGTTATRPPLAGKFGGAYVVFGKFADVWQPSASAPSSARTGASTFWVVGPEDVATVGAARGGVAINPDGSFSVQLLVSRAPALESVTGNYGIYTYSGGGAVHVPFETYTPVSFSTAPVVSVSKTTDLNPLGDTVTVSGWNFTPNAPATTGTRPPLAGKFGGAYVIFGRFADVWQPSASAPSSARKVGSQTWVIGAGDTVDGTVPLTASGSFSIEVPVSRSGALEAVTGNYGIYTYAGSGAVYAPFETATPIAFTPAAGTTLALAAAPSAGLVDGATTQLTATVSPLAPGTVAFLDGTRVLGADETNASGVASLATGALSAGTHTITANFVPADPILFAASSATLTLDVAAKSVAAGSLTWGIKQSFRDYVTSSIAHGSIITSEVGSSGGRFVFGQSTGGSFDAASGTGSSAYSGSVRFVGHGGELDVTMANPVVSVSSASSATLYVTVNGTSTAFATLNLAEGTRSTPGNAVAYSGVPASLTSAGAGVFSYNGSNFYAPGTALDPVSFVIGSPSSAGGGTRTVAAFAGEKTPAATPPATEGIMVDEKSLEDLEAGGEVTITADGFEPNETGILVVIYSDPIVLARDAKADADGVVTWTGRLPAELTGKHTLTLQGSVNRGVVLDIPARITTAAQGCTVDASTLTWGFKESFRSYISGSIANGSWTVADGATYETPDFSWTDGEGAFDADSDEGLVGFTGSITFTGHGGVLNTTVANPEVRFLDGDTAVLLLDVSGTTQEGDAIDQQDVEFVELDLSGGALSLDGDTLTVTAAPATLTASGSAAFGTYETGEEFDPVTLEAELDPGCAKIVEEETATDQPVDTTSATGPDLTWLLWLIVAIVLLAIAAAAVIIARRRKA